MKPILKMKIAVDAAMTLSMLLLMAYGLVGEAAPEWIGMGMFVLFVLHHILNRKWKFCKSKNREQFKLSAVLFYDCLFILNY